MSSPLVHRGPRSRRPNVTTALCQLRLCMFAYIPHRYLFEMVNVDSAYRGITEISLKQPKKCKLASYLLSAMLLVSLGIWFQSLFPFQNMENCQSFNFIPANPHEQAVPSLHLHAICFIVITCFQKQNKSIPYTKPIRGQMW